MYLIIRDGIMGPPGLMGPEGKQGIEGLIGISGEKVSTKLVLF